MGKSTGKKIATDLKQNKIDPESDAVKSYLERATEAWLTLKNGYVIKVQHRMNLVKKERELARTRRGIEG